MKSNRRSFMQTMGSAAVAAALGKASPRARGPAPEGQGRRFHYVQIDVFSCERLQGNALAVFTDARGLSDTEMQDISRETNLHETTFIFPGDAARERENGVKVRIFVPGEEIPFGGHPTLGTAMVLRNHSQAKTGWAKPSDAGLDEIALDLQVGKIPVSFRREANGNVFGEMHQVDPVFGRIHDRATVAALTGLKPEDISDQWPIQTVSTGLAFAIVPLKRLSTLES